MGGRSFSRAAVAAEQEACGAEGIRSPGGSLETRPIGVPRDDKPPYGSYSRGTRSLIAVRIS